MPEVTVPHVLPGEGRPLAAVPGGRSRTWFRRGLPLLAVVVLVVLHVFAYPATRFSNDSYRYARLAYEDIGDSPKTAQHKALQAYCRDTAGMQERNRSLAQTGFTHPAEPSDYTSCMASGKNGLWPRDPRYDRIFTTRPGYPLIAAPFVAVMGAKAGLTAVALGFTALAGLLVAAVLRALGTSRGLALLGQCLYYATPLTTWGGRPLTEGPTLATMAGMLLGAVWLLQRRVRDGALLLAGSLLLGIAVKYSNVMIAAPCMALAAAASLLFVRSARHRGTWWVLGLCAGSALGLVAAAGALNLPSSSATLQDTFTLHWSSHEVAHPYRLLLQLDANYWWQWLQQQSLAPLLLLGLALSAWGLWRRSVPVALLVLAAGATGILSTVVHPVASEGDRLYVQIWLVVVVGVPLLLHHLRRPVELVA